jgi:ubiquinone/menaquinone biosynthesis C-methylase UbiE
MRVLESASRRYDLGIRLFSFGHIRRIYDRVAELARGPEALDLGCGTGNVALRLAARGLRVSGLDLSPDMLDIARQKTPAGAAVRWVQGGSVELIDYFPPASFDTIISVLLFSELSEAEQSEVLRQCHVILRPGGQLLLADEVPAPTLARRTIQNLVRLPLLAITYALTQNCTSVVCRLEEKIAAAHFTLARKECSRLGDFVLLEAYKVEVPDAVAA